jgi:uncharacterized protein
MNNFCATPVMARQTIVAVAILLCSSILHGAEYQPIPKLEQRVTDVAKVLSVADKARLVAMLVRYERETFHQIAVLTVPTLSGESIEGFSLRVANAWGLGRKGVDNGILITLAMSERKVRIEIGLGMEKYISDATAQAIIANTMIPAFRRGDYAGGLEAGLERLMKEGRKFVVAPMDSKRKAGQ